MARTLLLAFFTLSIAGKVCCMLDFSKFHLPPCCFISSEDHFSGYSQSLGRNNVNTKREVSYEKIPLLKPDSKIHNVTHKFSSKLSKNKTISNTSKKSSNNAKIYRLVVPLGEIKVGKSQSTELPKTTQIMPPTTGRILFPEMKSSLPGTKKEPSKFKRNSNQATNKTKLLQEVIALELEDIENQKSVIGKKSLGIIPRQNNYSSRDLKVEHRSRSESEIFNTYIKWEPVKLHSKRQNTTKNSPETSRFVKRQTLRRMPDTWIKHLRRALYQSITAMDGISNTENLQSSNNEILFPNIWESISSAKLKFVDKTSLRQSDIPSAIYLPQGEGPVVSGILVNSRDGGLQLRVASEIHNVPRSSNGDQNNNNCRCYLVNNGEILVAYWSISRIFNKNRKPALQYLVYPLPHSVPTPPEFIQFTNGPMFMASPLDPMSASFYANTNTNNNYSPDSHFSTMTNQFNDYENFSQRNPKFVHELPNGHHRIEILRNNINSQQPTSSPFVQNPEYDAGYSGVPIEKDGQYMPEFLDMYRGAVQNHFNQNVNNNNDGISPFYGIPYNDMNIQQGPINYENPIPPNIPPVPLPTQFANPNEQFFVNQGPLLPTGPGPTGFPFQGDQLSKPPTTFPKSIQDIISPFPQPTGEPLPPLPLLEVPIRQEQPILPPQILHNIPALVNPTINPQNYPLNSQQLVRDPELSLNEEQVTEPYPPTILVQSTSTARPPDRNSNKDRNNNNIKQQDSEKANRPYTISNVLDNEKKYYPTRKPNTIVRDYPSKSSYRKKPIQDIDGSKGYILDF